MKHILLWEMKKFREHLPYNTTWRKLSSWTERSVEEERGERRVEFSNKEFSILEKRISICIECIFRESHRKFSKSCEKKKVRKFNILYKERIKNISRFFFVFWKFFPFSSLQQSNTKKNEKGFKNIFLLLFWMKSLKEQKVKNQKEQREKEEYRRFFWREYNHKKRVDRLFISSCQQRFVP